MASGDRGRRGVRARPDRARDAQRTATRCRLHGAEAEFSHPDFREALLAVAGEGGAVNGRRLGKWLAATRTGWSPVRIVQEGLICGVMQWRLSS